MHHGIVMVGPLFFAILLSAVYTGTSYAQVSKQLAPNTQLSSSSTSPKLHAVKITSPTKDENIPIGKSLMIIGTSLDNATSNCQVSVIVNSVKPYQPATATGHHGATDYSTWNFFLTYKYTNIKEGSNKITAKYVCSDNQNLRSFYNLNVTGVATATAAVG
jgi:hypothetical protein